MAINNKSEIALYSLPSSEAVQLSGTAFAISDTSEIAIRNLTTSVRSKRAISECAQEHAPHFSGAVLDKTANDSRAIDIVIDGILDSIKSKCPLGIYVE